MRLAHRTNGLSLSQNAWNVAGASPGDLLNLLPSVTQVRKSGFVIMGGHELDAGWLGRRLRSGADLRWQVGIAKPSSAQDVPVEALGSVLVSPFLQPS